MNDALIGYIPLLFDSTTLPMNVIKNHNFRRVKAEFTHENRQSQWASPVPLAKKEKGAEVPADPSRGPESMLWEALVSDFPGVASLGWPHYPPSPRPRKPARARPSKNPPDPVQPGLPFGYRTQSESVFRLSQSAITAFALGDQPQTNLGWAYHIPQGNL